MTRTKHRFTKFARHVAATSGHPASFVAALVLIALWGVSGPLFGFSDTWQLVINTGTTIVTFLMVFVIQNTQNSDTEAMQIKLDELIKVSAKANNALLRLEELDPDELERIKAGYEAEGAAGRSAARAARKPKRRKRKQDSGRRRPQAAAAS